MSEKREQPTVKQMNERFRIDASPEEIGRAIFAATDEPDPKRRVIKRPKKGKRPS